MSGYGRLDPVILVRLLRKDDRDVLERTKNIHYLKAYLVTIENISYDKYQRQEGRYFDRNRF